MLMPSLPPDLKPWMMRPRAGQRNSGETPAASAWAPVRGAAAAGCSGLTLPVGAESTGFLLAAAGAGAATSALATVCLGAADGAASTDLCLSFDLTAGASALTSAAFSWGFFLSA